MVSINICGSEQKLTEVTDSWLREQIMNRRANDVSVWIRVTIRIDRVNIVLTTDNCPRSPSSPRPPNRHEREIFDLWDSMGLKNPSADPGTLSRFLHKIGSMSF